MPMNTLFEDILKDEGFVLILTFFCESDEAAIPLCHKVNHI